LREVLEYLTTRVRRPYSRSTRTGWAYAAAIVIKPPIVFSTFALGLVVQILAVIAPWSLGHTGDMIFARVVVSQRLLMTAGATSCFRKRKRRYVAKTIR
jgi:hypothetical protein